jgi:hypothetical protein
MGFSIPGKVILKYPVPAGYFRRRDGIFFYLTIGIVGAFGYLCMGNRNLYSPAFNDLFFAAVTGSVVACLFSLLGKMRAVIFFAENGIAIPGRYSAFSAYKDIVECRMTLTKNRSETFYILNFTLMTSGNSFSSWVSRPIKGVAVPEKMIEPVLQILRDKGVKVVEVPSAA